MSIVAIEPVGVLLSVVDREHFFKKGNNKIRKKLFQLRDKFLTNIAIIQFPLSSTKMGLEAAQKATASAFLLSIHNSTLTSPAEQVSLMQSLVSTDFDPWA